MRFVKTVESIFDIPSGFTRVEYLETSGSKYYIDTGYKANNTTKVEIKTQGQTWTFGGRTSIAVGDALGICFNANLVALQFGSQSINYNQTGIAQQVSECVISQDGAYINGVLRASFTSETFSCPNNLYLFDINNNGSLGDGLKGKMWYCKIWDNDTLVRDFIPCIDPLGRSCMYDLVGKKPYYNQGTGEFTVGRQIIPVNYLESTGEQYIDTGYKPVPATTKFEFYFSPTTISGNYFPFGSRPNTSIGGETCTTYFSTGNIRQDWAGLNTYFPKINAGDKVLYSAYNNTVSLNNESVTGTVVRSTDRLDYNFLLFTVNTGGTADSRRYVGKVYYAKLWDDGTLVRNFVPCKDENNVGFMFDTVSGTVYENAGTGAFVVGQNKYKMKLRLIKDNILPTGYTQVEYLESSGTQYIDTGIAGSSTLKIEMNGQKSGASYGVYFGAGTGNNRIQAIYIGDQNSARIGNLTTNLGPDSEKFNVVVDTLNKNVIYNGTPYSLAYTSALTTLNIFIFTRNEGGSFADIATAKCWSFKIWDNGVLVRDFIPAIDPSGTPCMYDLVSRTPFYNAGTGTFTTGKPVLPIVRFPAEIVPAGYKAVNYLESTGTQYIDTGILPSEDLRTKVVQAFTGDSIAKNSSILGSNGSGNTRYWINYDNHFEVGYGNYLSTHTVVQPDEVNTIDFNYIKEDNKHYFSFNGTVYTTTGTPNTQYSIILFGRVVMDNDPVLAPQRIYKVQFIRNNTLVRNFIPVIRLLDNKAGMWDTVTKQFYTTPVGDFITG